MTSMTATATSDGSASTASDGAVYTGFSNSDSSSAGSTNSGSIAARLALNFGELYGIGVVAVGVVVGFTSLM
jgi:hypothetical protein